MAFTTGTATDYVDLLDKLRAYLLAQGWTILDFNLGTINGGGNLFVRAPGAGADKQVFVQIYTEANAALGQYGWRMRGSTGYVSGAGEGAQPGQSGSPAYFNLWQNSISYWLYVNDRRFMIVAKMSTVYASAYCGFFLPFSQPDNYPFPLYIAGNYPFLAEYNLSNAANRFFVDPGGNLFGVNNGAHVRTPTGVWLPVQNHDFSSSNDDGVSPGRAAFAFTWPYCVGESQFGTPGYAQAGTGRDATGGGMLDNLVRTRQSELGLFPVSIHPALEPALGVLDGAYCPWGDNIVTEQTATVGLRNFRFFQNMFRNSPNDFMALEEI